MSQKVLSLIKFLVSDGYEVIFMPDTFNDDMSIRLLRKFNERIYFQQEDLVNQKCRSSIPSTYIDESGKFHSAYEEKLFMIIANMKLKLDEDIRYPYNTYQEPNPDPMIIKD